MGRRGPQNVNQHIPVTYDAQKTPVPFAHYKWLPQNVIIVGRKPYQRAVLATSYFSRVRTFPILLNSKDSTPATSDLTKQPTKQASRVACCVAIAGNNKRITPTGKRPCRTTCPLLWKIAILLTNSPRNRLLHGVPEVKIREAADQQGPKTQARKNRISQNSHLHATAVGGDG
jgi:hypothetical protein